MNLQLFHKWTCPYSARVRDFIEEKKLRDRIEYIDRDENETNKQKLKDRTGKTQVPCLFIEGKPLFESDEIISWLKENLLQEQRPSA